MAKQQVTKASAPKMYDGSQIRIISDDMQRVREKPSMYIGDLEHGVFTLMREVFDNCVDEHSAGRNSSVNLVIDSKTRKVVIWDSGQGIPTEQKAVGTKKLSALEAVFSHLHAGGKFDGKAYKTSIGSHGIGVKAVNALSSELTVMSAYAKGPMTMCFKRGKKVSEKKGATIDIGTHVTFVPDTQIFGTQFLGLTEVQELCQQTAYLNPKLRIKLVFDKQKFSYYEPQGLKTLLVARAGKAGHITKPWTAIGSNVSLALLFTDGQNGLTCHTNSLHNENGGTHQDTLVEVLLKTLKSAMSSRDKPFGQTELLDGLVGVLDVKLSAPRFSSQSKEKLVDPRVKTDLKPEIEKLVAQWATANKSKLSVLVKRMGQLRELRANMQESKKLLSVLKSKRGGNDLPEKLTIANCKPEERELYVVEGDSASGTAKKARFPYQEILPLRGKITNAMKAKEAAVLASEEVISIFKSMGYDPSKPEPLDHLRVSKVILMCDPDADGSHINALILTLLLKYMAGAFKRPLIYLAVTSEYTAVYKGKRYFANDAAGLRAQGVPDTVKATHIKGYGELAPEGLRTMTMDPKTRNLIRLTEPTKEEMAQIMKLMSEDPGYRRKLFEVVATVVKKP